MFYQICDAILESNIDLPELSPLRSEAGADFRLQLESTKRPDERDHDWYHHWRSPSGKIWLSFAKIDSAYLLRFPGKADFLILEGGKDAKCLAEPHLPLETLRHLFLDQVFPLVLSNQGRLVLHASAVVVPCGAIAFAGRTGEGKSTLSASLNRIGYPLITDDCLVLKEEGNQVSAVPSYPGFRLWADAIPVLYSDGCEVSRVAHYTKKSRLDLIKNRLPFSKGPAPLHRIYILNRQPETGNASSIRITTLSKREALMQLLSYSYHLDIMNTQNLWVQLDRFTRLPSIFGVRSLTLPCDIQLLPEIHKMILEDCAAT